MDKIGTAMTILRLTAKNHAPKEIRFYPYLDVTGLCILSLLLIAIGLYL